MRVAVIGAGFFGSLAAIRLAESGHDVDLLEQHDDIMQGASKHNHNRIHFGYHYLRSIETAEESREGLATFLEFFGTAICSEFANYYCIAAENSKSSPEQFERFCDRVGIAYQPEYPDRRFLERSRLAASYRVPEPVFDYFRAHALLTEHMVRSKLTFHPNTRVTEIERKNDHFRVTATCLVRTYDAVVNCAYTNLNQMREMVGAPRRTYLYEDVVIPVFKYRHPMIGLTVMDGEFCSVMPRGLRVNEFLLYHVKHSILARNLGSVPPVGERPAVDTRALIEESATYMPFLREAAVVNHYRWMRVVMENDDDARRSIINNDVPNYWSVLSGKVTTCVKVANELSKQVGA